MKLLNGQIPRSKLARCAGHLGIIPRKPGRNTRLQALNGHCLECGYRLAWGYSCNAESHSSVSILFIVYHTKSFCIAV